MASCTESRNIPELCSAGVPQGARRVSVPGYEGLYEVDDQGWVHSLPRRVRMKRKGGVFDTGVPGGTLKPNIDRYGYEIVSLQREGKAWRVGVHRLVCISFHGQPLSPDMQAAHGDGVKTNNVPGNLRWATPAENNEDRRAHGVHPMGNRLPHAKLTPEKVRKVVEMASAGIGPSEIARTFGVSATAICKVLKGKSWAHVTGFERHPDILAEIDRLAGSRHCGGMA